MYYSNTVWLIREEDTHNWIGWRQMFVCGSLGETAGMKTGRQLWLLKPQRTFLSFLSPSLVATDGHVSKAAVVAAICCRVFFPLSLVNDRQMRGKGSKLHEGFKESAFPRYPKETKIWKCFYFFLVLKRKWFYRFILRCEVPLKSEVTHWSEILSKLEIQSQSCMLVPCARRG